MDWYRFSVVYVLCVIIPTWVINFIPISLFNKLVFTIGGAIAVYVIIASKFD